MSETSTSTATPATEPAMSNDSAPILLRIYEELAAIRELLARAPAAPSHAPASSYSGGQSSASGQSEPPRQPTALLPNPGAVLIPFGKNKDRPLSELSERSLEWYASEQPPKLKNDGTPFTPRPADIAFKNAARQLFHQQRGTLAGSLNPTERQTSTPAPSGAGAASEENIPFAARYYDHG